MTVIRKFCRNSMPIILGCNAMNMKKLALSVLILLYSFGVKGFDSEKVRFTISLLGEVNSYRIYSVFVLPGTDFKISSESDISLKSEDIQTIRIDEKNWTVQAPQKTGCHILRISDSYQEEIRLNVLVLTPISEKRGEYLTGYRIGYYPMVTTQTNPIYYRPGGFFEVTKDNQDMLLTPHFKLSQFLCKQNSGYPKYLIVRERLLLKLEYLLELVNDNGYHINTFGFISGFRTPYYNKSINNVSKSRHIYGGAADIFIDQNEDGFMDDLNLDGNIDQQDIRIFYDIVEKASGKPEYDHFKGGLGFYRKNSVHHGFIHVDVRGWKARW